MNIHILNPETVSALGITDTNELGHAIRTIKHMTAAAAEKHINSTYPWLTLEAKLDLIALTVKQQKPDLPFVKGHFYAVAWACGATWGQIAGMFAIKPSTAARLASGYINAATRAEYMQTRSKYSTNISINHAAAVLNAYKRLLHEDHNLIRDASVLIIARRIDDMVKNDYTLMPDEIDESSPHSPADFDQTQVNDAFSRMFGK